MTVATALSGSGNLTNAASATLNLGGTTTITTLTATANPNTVNYTGGAQNILNTAYYNLTLSGSGAKSIVSGTSIAGNLSIVTGAKASIGTGLPINAATLAFGGAGVTSGLWGSTSSTATYQNDTYFAATSGMVLVGSSSCTTGTWLGTTSNDWNDGSNWCGGTPDATIDVVIPTSAPNWPTLSTGETGNCKSLTLSSAASTLNFTGGNLIVAGNVTFSGGVITSNTLASTLSVGGAWTGTVTTFTPNTYLTVDFTGASQTIPQLVNYYNLTLSGSGLKTAGGAITVNGTLTLNITTTSTIFDISGYTLTINGSITKTSGTITTSSTSSLSFGNNAASLTLPNDLFTSSPPTIQSLTINRAGGITLGNQGITISGSVTLTSGILTTGINTILISSSGGTITGSPTSYIDGKLARVIGSTTAKTFPIGKGGNYRPVIFTYTSAPTPKTVTIEQFESGSPLSLDYVSTARFGSRYWNITQSEIGTYKVQLNNGGLTPTGTAVIVRREGTGAVTANATTTPVYTNTTAFTTSDLSNDVQLGETNIPLTITGVTANNKTYDGNVTAVINTGSAALSGVVGGDNVTLNSSSSAGSFANKNVGTGKSIATAGFTISGTNYQAYTLTQPATTASITALALTITAAANTKTYDGNTSAAAVPTLTTGTLAAGDVATYSETYDTKNQGSGKTMTPAVSIVDGSSVNMTGNYTVTQLTSANGTISARPIVVTANTDTKTFDGNTTSSVAPTVPPLQSGDAVTTAPTQTFDYPNVGIGKTLTASGLVINDGNGGNNYTITYSPNTTGVILAATSTTWKAIATTNDWNTAINWTPPVVPVAGISATIQASNIAPVIAANGIECQDLSISSGSLTISDVGTLTVNGTLTNDVGTSGLVIASSSAGTGSLLNNTASVSATVERYIGGASWGWHFLSSPIAVQAISPEFVLSSTSTGEDFYSWSETAQLWVNFKNTTVAPTWNAVNGNTNFIPGRGYLVAYQTTGTTKNFVGSLNAGTVTYTLTNTGTGTNQSYNLVGNPYPCAIDWDAASGWGRGNLDGTQKSYWVWNDAAGNYGTYINNDPIGGTNDVTQYIASGQGFIVKASAAGDLTMNDDVKVHDAQPFLKSKINGNNELRLKLSCNANTYRDEAIVAFNTSIADGGAEKFSSMYTNAPELWSVKNGNKYSINFMGDVSAAEVVPLSVKAAGAAGTYTLTASQVESFSGNSAISLEDRATGTFTYLGTTPSYTFQVSAPATITDRFFLHFMDVTGVPHSDIARNFNMYTTDGVLYIQSLQQMGGKIAVVDMLGCTVATGRVEAGATTRIDMHGNTGVYIVSILTGKGISNTKVIVK